MPSRDPHRSYRPTAQPPTAIVPRAIRKRSDYEYLGMPLWSVAVGPDLAKGENRGHAKGVIAIGDMATGIFALGGLARGFIAVGGLAMGVFAVGGLAFGGLASGGLAIGIMAIGGGAIGWTAIGGAAAGYYAAGGAAWGTFVVSAMERSPEAVAFFTQWDVLRMFLPPNMLRR